MDFSIINGKTIHHLIHTQLDECVRVVRDAYLAHHSGQSINPNSYFLRFPDQPKNRIIALPAHLGGDFRVSGIKWIASFPDNIAHDIPRASAVLILNSVETGYPFACLEASVISAARTAASAALAAVTLHGRRQAASLGIVGTGFIARYVYNFLVKTGWEIDTVRLFDTNPADAERFAAGVCLRERHRRIEVAPALDDLLTASELVVFATTAAKPYVHDPALFAHNPILLNVSLRDLDPAIILASHNVVDDVGHVLNANTSVHLAEQQTGGRAFIDGTLAGLIKGEYALTRTRPIVFSPFGLGVLDLAVGRWVYDQAIASGRATTIDDFFFDLSR